MSDLLATGISALLAYRKALDTAGHNIANVATPGYSRQRVELVSRLGTAMGDGYIGSGVNSATVRRLTDAFVGQRIATDSANFGRADALDAVAGTLDSWLSGSSTSLTQPLGTFFSGLNDLAASPTSSAARQTVLADADTLASRFRDLQGQFDGLQDEIDSRIRQGVSDVNTTAKSIAALNDRIVLAQAAAGGQPPNDLLDQRDLLLQDLAGQVGISTVAADDGSVNVYTGSGQALVLGKQAGTFAVTDDAYGGGGLDLTFDGGIITGQVGGGTLGGLLDARRQLLDPAQAQLGRLAVGLATAVNAQNAKGIDAAGQRGGDVFTAPQPSVLSATANTGGAQVSAAFADVGALDGSNYELRFDGSSWQLRNTASGANVAMTGSGTPADPFKAAGLSIAVSGTANAGDRFLVKPTAGAAGQLRMAITDGSLLAAASPVRASAGIANTGTAAIGGIDVTDAGNAALGDDVAIAFTGPNTYSINGSGSFTYTPGQPLSANGWSLTLSGAPAAGDTFSVTANGANSSDNGNAKALTAIADLKILDGGRSTLNAAQAALVSNVGNQAQQASVQKDAQSALLEASTAQRDATSGVNLDEEASDLVRFQQAYQAAAQVIAVADTVFQSLLNATRGQ